MNTSHGNRKRWYWVLAASLLIALMILFNPEWMVALWRVLSVDSITTLAAYVRGFGLWAPVISILLMLLQSVIAPLPAWLVAGANGIGNEWRLTGVHWGSAHLCKK